MSTTQETDTPRRSLPPGFLFGVATAAYHIEGGPSLSGRTPSIRDIFSGIPGRIADGRSGQVAVDHIHRWAEDLVLLADLGVGAYRFSLSWPRVHPHGSGPASPDGIGFYDRVVDVLPAADIQPFVSLYHWDLPLELMEHGGWRIRETADYAELAASALGDRVTAWTTAAEPLLHMGYGHAMGIDAPGLALLGGAFQATHLQLLAHGRAVQVLRRGHHPDEIVRMPGAADDVISDGDLAVISAPLDFYGVSSITPRWSPRHTGIRPFRSRPEEMRGLPLTDSGWPAQPASLTRLLMDLTAEHPSLPPLYVAANGCAYQDVENPIGGSVIDAKRTDDVERIAYPDDHLAAIADGVGAGRDIHGYFYSTLLDCWEWTDSFTRNFGLDRGGSWVDPETLDRHPRTSFHHYRDLISGHRADQ